MPHAYHQHEDTPLWRTVAGALADLRASGDIVLGGPHEHVVGYLCERITALDAEDEDEDAPYFYRHHATLRIFGEDVPFERITATLGLEPTHTHRRGERRAPGSDALYPHDMWAYTPPVDRERELTAHVAALHAAVALHLDFLKSLRERCTVDVFCAYTSSSPTAGFTVDHEALRLFTELETPFGVSVVIA